MSLFLHFAELNDALAATTKKLAKRALIAEYLQALPLPDSGGPQQAGSPGSDAGRAALWLSGTPFPETDRRVLNVGGSLLSKALAQLSGATQQAMGAAYRRHGDLGAAAADLLYGHSPDSASLALAEVESALAALAEARGPAPKLRLLVDLLARATPVEAKYLVKLVSGDMRTGVRQSLVEEAIADAWLLPGDPASTRSSPAAVPAALVNQVRRASMLLGSLPEVVALAAAGRLDEARMKLFHPIGFMLASPVQSVDEAIARFTEEIKAEAAGVSDAVPAPSQSVLSAEILMEERASAPEVLPSLVLRAAQLEDKFDGIRAQLHVEPASASEAGIAGVPAGSSPGRVALYSRNREDLSESFPELVEAFAAIGEPAILDGEILAWDPATGRALSFSALQQRLGRKRIGQDMLREIPAVLVVFDILYCDGRLLLNEPLAARRSVLESFAARWLPSTASRHPRGQVNLFSEPGPDFPRLILASATRLDTAAQLDQAYLDARARGNEGVMIKSLASLYQPGRRGLAWLKLKRELATLDVVVTGVEYGNGRRAQVLSDYTFAIRDLDDPAEPLKNFGKAYSGLTDQEINDLTAFFKAHTLEDHGHFRTVEPVIVLEVAFNNVMRSTRHASGFALRFPRILRIRDDKPPGEIDTLARVEEIYNSQPDKPVDET